MLYMELYGIVVEYKGIGIGKYLANVDDENNERCWELIVNHHKGQPPSPSFPSANFEVVFPT